MSHENSKYGGSQTYVKTMELPTANGEFSTFGTISSSDLSLTCTSAYWITAGVKYLYVTVSYDWINKPFWGLTDEIGITWDSSKFQVVDGDYDFSATIVDNVNTHDARELNSANIIGDFNIGSAARDNYGYANVLLKVKPGQIAPSSTVIYFKYGHAMVVPTVSLSIDQSGFGIAISGSVNVDSLAKSKTFNLYW